MFPEDLEGLEGLAGLEGLGFLGSLCPLCCLSVPVIRVIPEVLLIRYVLLTHYIPEGLGGLGFQDFLDHLCLPLNPCLLLASPANPEYPRDQANRAFLVFLVSKSNSFDHNVHMVASIGCSWSKPSTK